MYKHGWLLLRQSHFIHVAIYCIVAKFGRGNFQGHTYQYCSNMYKLNKRGIPYGEKVWWGKIWQTDSFRAFGKRKFSELIDQSIARAAE